MTPAEPASAGMAAFAMNKYGLAKMGFLSDMIVIAADCQRLLNLFLTNDSSEVAKVYSDDEANGL